MFEIPDIQLNQYGKPARIMFLAPYAPDAPDFSKKPYTGNGGYPQYHYNIYKAIQDIGYDVVSSSKPYSVQFAKGNVDYVFSLMNRFAMSRPEIFISSYCEFIQIPYLGAPPNIRAIAEDKLLTKMVFRSLERSGRHWTFRRKRYSGPGPFPRPLFCQKAFWSRFRRHPGRQHLQLLESRGLMRPAPDGRRARSARGTILRRH